MTMYLAYTTKQGGDTEGSFLIRSTPVMAKTFGIVTKRTYSEEEIKTFRRLDQTTPQIEATLKKLLQIHNSQK